MKMHNHSLHIAALLLSTLLMVPLAFSAERPNILWITAEDMSANLGCYGDAYARTPNLDRFAEESVRYTRAYATAPVCSPARSTLITGVYATSLGTQRLRSEFPLPDAIKGFPSYLREIGYYTSNNVKTDYNIADEEEFIAATWDRSSSQAHWRQRDAGQPFFSVFNLMTTHQSRANVWPWEQFEEEIGSRLSPAQRHDPTEAPLPPYYPDTETVRRTVARYYDCITLMDQQVGALLNQLEEDGLADDTIVFFYSDHGMGMPRGKRVLHDSGMHVPLIIRFPKKWSHLAPGEPGTATNRLVSFVDFPPTVLSLLNLNIPDYMQGKPFLGSHEAAPRDYLFGARDRVDEAFDLSRSIRDERYLLIENYFPHLSWMPPERYSDNAEIRRQLQRMAEALELNEPQMTYAARHRFPIEFYDTVTDPHQVRNLIDDPDYQPRIQAMSARLHRWQRETGDLGFFTEPEIRRRTSETTPWEYGQNQFKEFNAELFEAARTAVWTGDLDRKMELLKHDDPAIRYWGALGLNVSDTNDSAAVRSLRDAMNDSSASVRIEAAAALIGTDRTEQAVELLVEELTSSIVENRLHAMRTLELAVEDAEVARDAMEQARQEAAAREGENPIWMFVRFSAEAALEKMKDE